MRVAGEANRNTGCSVRDATKKSKKGGAVKLPFLHIEDKRGHYHRGTTAPLFTFVAILICPNVLLGWRSIRVRSSMMVAPAVVLAGVMIGVMPMGVVRRRLRMGSIGHG